VARVVQCLPGKFRALSSNPGTEEKRRKGRKEGGREGGEGRGGKEGRKGL
jgi:hypothetical protein